MRVHLATLGCRLNEAERQGWARAFRARGYPIVGRAQDADLIVLNTCAVTGEATRKSNKLARRLHRQSPSAKVVLTGCHATLAAEQLADMAGVDMVLSNRDKDRLVPLVVERFADESMPRLAMDADGAHMFAQRRTRVFVKVQDGCRNRCTFCVVTLARGAERSRPIGDVVKEIQGLEAQGIPEVVLTGVHLGGYGSDLEGSVDLQRLVAAVLEGTQRVRVRLGSLEPWDLPKGFFTLWQHSRLAPHLHLPLQSGSDTVLRRMARRCSTAEYAELVRSAHAHIDGLNVTTDLIVGFPGESAEEWQETLDFVGSLRFGHIHTFTYSPRVGTRAARLPAQIPRSIARERSQQAHDLATRQRMRTLAAHVGTVRDVLWEESRTEGEWAGYTDNYLRVKLQTADRLGDHARMARVKLVAVTDDGNALRGAWIGRND